MTDEGSEWTAPAAFEAVLYPNQPPPARSLVLLVVAVAGVALGLGIGFFLAGAWPVAGFVGIELALLIAALLWTRRGARYREHVRLDRTGLHVRAVAGNRLLREWRFEPYWVRVRLEPARHGERLLQLSAHGSTLTLGRFLTSDERCAFAAALNRALGDYRSPGS